MYKHWITVRHNETLDRVDLIRGYTIEGGKRKKVIYRTLADLPYENIEAKYLMLRMISDGMSIKGVGSRGRQNVAYKNGRELRTYTNYFVEV